MKGKGEVKRSRSLVFAVNGERFELERVDPGTTLLEFLRTRTRFTGAKLGCGEGGCGACVVLLSTYDPVHEQVNEYSVSSCLTLLCSINLCSVTTTEGLGNIKNGFHSIHQRFSGFHASQCGFCTPGMCMSLFSSLINADKTQRPKPPDGFSKITVAEAENAIAGNLCRCTGYRPIIDACKSFAADVDLEDLGLNSFWKKGEKDANVKRLPFYSPDGISTFPDFLKSEIKSSLPCFSSSLPNDLTNPKLVHLDVSSNIQHLDLVEGHWCCPSTVDELYELLNSNEYEESSVKMVVGNTGSGVYKELDLYDKYIDLKGIQELSLIKWDSKGIEIGAAVTISKVIKVLKEDSEGMFLSNERLIFIKIADHMSKVASGFVRNAASLGGNLILAQRNQFPSDIATILLAADSTVSIQTPSRRIVLTLEEFLEGPCDSKTLLLSIYIPCLKSACNSSFNINNTSDIKSERESKFLFQTYRAAPRPLGNAVSYLNSAFLAQLTLDKMSGILVLESLRLAFGAYGGRHAIRARKVENFLLGKPVTAFVLLEAFRLLRETIAPIEGTAHSAYRQSLGVAFLFRFLQQFLKGPKEPRINLHLSTSDTVESAQYLNGSLSRCIDISPCKVSEYVDLEQSDDPYVHLSSKQIGEFSTNYYPVGEPIKKTGAEIQASGIFLRSVIGW